METTHKVVIGDARPLDSLVKGEVDLVVTSPPYPMIEMWDSAFSAMSPAAKKALAREDGPAAFEACHAELDKVWERCYAVLRPGGIACINIGDATRTIGGEFRLYPNHARIISAMARIGFSMLPDILWRKPNNSPNKFMGSGMLPAGAYVTYEHEYILIFRKGGRREFTTAEEKANRRRSAFFWEERNVWFSDIWADLPGTRQAGKNGKRTGAFPFELAWRLILMYSAYGDTVLDPFLGTGTTSAAALVSGRNSIGVEIDKSLKKTIEGIIMGGVETGARRNEERIQAHMEFVARREVASKPMKHRNRPHGFPVVTGQERDMEVFRPVAVRRSGPGEFKADLESGAKITPGL